MTESEITNYIRSHNLDVRTVEQIVSFFFDNERCRLDWWSKKEIVRYVQGNNFENVWPLAVKEIERISKEQAKFFDKRSLNKNERKTRG